jgi:hypothetical protein
LQKPFPFSGARCRAAATTTTEVEGLNRVLGWQGTNHVYLCLCLVFVSMFVSVHMQGIVVCLAFYLIYGMPTWLFSAPWFPGALPIRACANGPPIRPRPFRMQSFSLASGAEHIIISMYVHVYMHIHWPRFRLVGGDEQTNTGRLQETCLVIDQLRL